MVAKQILLKIPWIVILLILFGYAALNIYNLAMTLSYRNTDYGIIESSINKELNTTVPKLDGRLKTILPTSNRLKQQELEERLDDLQYQLDNTEFYFYDE